MRLKKLRVEGFQSFSDSGDIYFNDGLNLLVGQNNSGKSSLLRVMLPNVIDVEHFHRTPARWEISFIPEPVISFEFEISGSEICDWALRFGNRIYYPLHPQYGVNLQEFRENLKSMSKMPINLRRGKECGFSGNYPSHNLFVYDGGNQRCISISPSNGRLDFNPQFSANDTLPDTVWAAWQQEMFYFAAERLMVGESGPGRSERLNPNASNLPNVLHTLQNERGDLFKKLVGHLAEIFPTVGNLSIRSKDSGALEVCVWPTNSMERVQLSFPLNSSGTGVAQAIAILTAVMTQTNSVFIIDEINNFLHPSAVKSLIRILQTEYNNHQYIISTHAPEVISFSNSKTIHIVKREGYESRVERLNLEKIDTFREVAQHLGVSMSDVFAANRIIWVEGPTEELAFPYIYQIFSASPVPSGTIFTAVAATGDFNRKRDREIVYEVYRRLSSAAAPLVVATIFSFDMEQLNPSEMADMTRESGDRLRFLPRRHIECYLLDPAAIAVFISSRSPNSGQITASQVQEKLIELAATPKFHIREWAGDISGQAWLERVDAARLIGSTVTDLSDSAAVFRKKEDSLELVQQIVLNNKELLRPLFEYVQLLVNTVAEDRS